MFFSHKDILKIAFPLIISGFGQSVIYVTDILFLGRLGNLALGASAIAGLLYASLIMIGFGISSGIQIIIAQKTGEQKESEIPVYLFSGMLIQIFIAFTITLFYYIFNTHIIDILVHNKDIQYATQKFLNIRIAGLLPYFLFYAYRSYYLGIGKTNIISVTTILMSALNLLLNPLLIYGWETSIPSMNYEGSALASVIAEWISMFVIMIYYAYHKKSIRFLRWIDFNSLKFIVQLSIPLIFQHFISVFSWFLFFVFIEKMGPKELAISNIIRAVYMLVMASILAFSHSTITIAGQLYGAKKFQDIKSTLYKIIMLSITFTLPFSIISLIRPEWLMFIFTNDSELINDGKNVMHTIALALILFAFTMPWLSALTGIGKTGKVLLIESISFFIYISISIVFVFIFHWPLYMVWLNEFVYFFTIFTFSKYFLNKALNKLS